MMSDDETAANEVILEGSIVDQILSAFVVKVEAESGLADAGGRLRHVLLEAREDSETELRRAIFGGDEK